MSIWDNKERMKLNALEHWRMENIWKPVFWLGVFFVLLFLVHKYNEKKEIVRCYEEQANSYSYPESFFTQSEFKEFCLENSIAIKEIGIDYEYLPYDYGTYIASLDSVCPFVSTAVTGDCLDKEIDKQKQRYENLSREIVAKAKIISEQARTKNEPVDLAISGILESLPAYTKIKDAYIQQICSVKNYATTGTAIVGESRKCFMYYNNKDIRMLEQIASSI